jgi:hypothetical protein
VIEDMDQSGVRAGILSLASTCPCRKSNPNILVV